MTFNGVVPVILRYFTEFGSFRVHYVKVIEDRLILSATQMWSKNPIFSDVSFMAIFAEVTKNQYDRIRYLSCSTISVLLSPQSILEKPQNRPLYQL